MAIYLLVFILLIECSVVFLQGTNIDGQSLLKLIETKTELTKFSSLLRKSEETEWIFSCTIFAPNNTAFDILPPDRQREINNMDKRQASEFVRSHMVYERFITLDRMTDNGKYKSMAARQNVLYTNVKRGERPPYEGVRHYYINGARIINGNIRASNGILHILDKVTVMASNKPVYSYILNPDDPLINSSKFLGLLEFTSEAKEKLTNAGRLTFFLPDDKFINQINTKKISQLTGNREECERVMRYHMLFGDVVFTSFVRHREQYEVGQNPKFIYKFQLRKNKYDEVYITSGLVTAKIIKGNITVSNGVIHVVDRLLNFRYNDILEQIAEDPQLSLFKSLLSLSVNPDIEKTLRRKTGVTLFVPVNSAFKYIGKYKEKLQTDMSFLNKILQQHFLHSGAVWELTNVDGNYESREERISMWGWPIKAYNFDYEMYVEASYVKAKVLRPDYGMTNGIIHYIDRIFGIPDMDIPSLIFSESWLKERTYYAYQVTGLLNALQDPTKDDDKLKYSDELCPHYTRCDFTVFVPNGTAIENFLLNQNSREIARNKYSFRYVLKRLIVPNEVIHLDQLVDGDENNYISANGEKIRFHKYGNRYVEILFGFQKALVIHSDLGATNGVIHIIDNLLWVQQDLYRTNKGSAVSKTVVVLLSLSFVTSFSLQITD